MKKEMLINVLQSEECRIAILEDNVLEELYVERASNESYVGNIYKGRIVNIEPSIQAAFVDFGVGRNGFLHVSDVEPTYWKHLERGSNGSRGDRGGRDRGERERPQLPAYLQGMDLEDIEDRPARVEQPLVNRVGSEPPVSRAGNDFAAGVEEEAPPAPKAEAEPEGDDPSKAELDAEPLKAHPETVVEEEPKRRRSRSGSGRRRGPKAAGSDEAPAEESKPADEPPDEPKPRLMDSAEHRTEKGSGGDTDLDPDLFFPSKPAPAPAPFRAPEPEPEPEPVFRREPEPVYQPEPVRERPRVEDAPPPRPRGRVRKHASVEDALEADLAEAEIGEEEPGQFIDSPPPPAREPDADAPPDEDRDDEFAPPRREGRGEGRREGRGDRDRGDRDRGGRGRGGPRGRRERGGRDGGGGGRPGPGRPRPLIQDVFKRGQEVIVQVIKEGIGSKGPTLSTYISIPGRYLVLMPCLNRTGVSRKIEDDEQRRRLRQMFNELKPPRGLGFIMRTAAIDKNKKEVQRDLVYLARLWQVIGRRIKKMKSPAEIYQESEMVMRTIRDNFTADIDTIWVDEPNAFQSAQEFMQVVMPRYADRIKFYEGKEPLFFKFGIEDEIHKIQQKKIPLPYGGSIVIEQTEALVAIDVNSGNFRADNNAEATAYQMNLHAAKEIARQLRLRDLGGVIVNDFIDMRDEKHRRDVERALRDAMRRDRARTKILRISQFGIIEMTRQRVRPSLKRAGYIDCPHCKGAAMVKTPETMAIEVMRMIQLASCKEAVVRVEIGVAPDIADYLLNKRRGEIVKLEEAGTMTVSVRALHAASAEHLVFSCLDRNDNEVRLMGPDPVPVTYRPRR